MAKSKEMTSGAPLPLILNFTVPLLLGNLLQQTYSFVDAAIVGKFLGINALASVGASTSVVFLILGFRYSCCSEIRCTRLCHYAQICIGQPETGWSDVCCYSHCYESALCLYLEMDADTR